MVLITQISPTNPQTVISIFFLVVFNIYSNKPVDKSFNFLSFSYSGVIYFELYFTSPLFVLFSDFSNFK
jgi:hypothetical protein